ncbi:fimbrial biogenesis chaperone [Oceanospirillum sediminis]|uniref:Molecular chaperone n=1 Tax=Oceanospirillum sediminis TaxID=2760088 RepID=A0A839IW50_9GAMM|nr:molecular chaperone [Oceanospirillum sediminis]MBB1488854.1 molecular chaperone [Oceanospirillum sediminis]
MTHLRLLLLFLAFLPGISYAQLAVFPEKVVFEPGQRSVRLNLQNRGNETYTYRIGWQDIVMDSLGLIKQVDDEKNPRKTPAASKMIRYAPRQVILEPGETQAVRVMLRRPADLKDGEYRSHMLFQRLQTVKGINTPATATTPGISMDLLIGTSIPVFVRQGDGEADLEFNNLELKKKEGKYFLNMQVERKGLYSSRAVVNLYEDGNNVPVMMSVQVMYTDNDRYTYSIPVQNSAAIDRNKKYILEIEYNLRNGEKQLVRKNISI